MLPFLASRLLRCFQFIQTLSLEDLRNPQTVLAIIRGAQMVVSGYAHQREMLSEALAIFQSLSFSPDRADFRDIIDEVADGEWKLAFTFALRNPSLGATDSAGRRNMYTCTDSD